MTSFQKLTCNFMTQYKCQGIYFTNEVAKANQILEKHYFKQIIPILQGHIKKKALILYLKPISS